MSDIDPLLQFFDDQRFPEYSRKRYTHFSALAQSIVETLPRNGERDMALRKLLEAQDCLERYSWAQEEIGGMCQHTGQMPASKYFGFPNLETLLPGLNKLFQELVNSLRHIGLAEPESETILRKLLESRDCAARAKIYKG